MRLPAIIATIALAAGCLASGVRDHCLLIRHGLMESSSRTPEQVVDDYVRSGAREPLVIHFHGGLVSEPSAISEARSLEAGPYSGSYPVFFVWNADFWTQLSAAAQTHEPKALAGLTVSKLWDTVRDPNAWKRAGNAVADEFKNGFVPAVQSAIHGHDGQSVSYGGDVLEWIGANWGGRQIWEQMKTDMNRSFMDQGAGLRFVRALKKIPGLIPPPISDNSSLGFWGARFAAPAERADDLVLPARPVSASPKIVLVGHSAGCIYILDFLRAAKRELPGAKFDVVFVAPAATYAETASFLRQNRDTIGRFRMYGLSEAQERRDHMLWELSTSLAGVYPGSLLNFVSRSVEDDRNTPVLGMQRYLTPRAPEQVADNRVVHRFLLDKPGAACWSPCPDCRALSHGRFFEDPATTASIRRFIGN